ncbi:MAG: methionyl aminopeptidase [Chlamydiales bacterium]|jgi:methionyl aminopeptidase
MFGRNDPCWCGSEKKWKKCHYPEVAPLSKRKSIIAQEYKKKFNILIKNDKEIEGIRNSGRLAAKILDATVKAAKEGVSTEDLNKLAHQMHLDAGAIPAPLNYGHPPFPKSICTSVNEVVCHGIPDNSPLIKGDIVNIDVTCILNGYYGDCSRMVVIGGETSPERQRVVDVSLECLNRSIAIMKPGTLLSEIGNVIEPYAQSKRCSVVHQFVGHGVGVNFHEAPQIYHNMNDVHIPVIPGMTFTIEPMVNAGVAEAVIDSRDHWTARTKDGKASGQWEHTLLITDDGCEILTAWPKG